MKTAKKIALLAIIIYDAVCVYGYFSILNQPETVPVSSCNTPNGQIANCGTVWLPHWFAFATAIAWDILIGCMYFANYWTSKRSVQ